MSDYWGIEDSEWFDEDGFAKGLPADHPARAMKQAIDLLTGQQPQIKIRKDYTQEFSDNFMKTYPQAKLLRVTTRNPITTPGELIFDFYFVINDRRYAYTTSLFRHDMETVERFNEHRFYLYRQAAHNFHYHVQKLCEHDWQKYYGHVKCSICNLEQDTPSGNKDWSAMFK